MLQLIRSWFDICLMRLAPQDLPASGTLLKVSLCCYALVSLLVSLRSYGFAGAVQIAIFDSVLLIVFVSILLYLLSSKARINQTLSAMAGSGSLLGLFALPFVLVAETVQTADQVPAGLVFFWLLLLVWNLLVMAHILRHAMSSSFPAGLGVSVLYALVSMQVIAKIFPQQGA